MRERRGAFRCIANLADVIEHGGEAIARTHGPGVDLRADPLRNERDVVQDRGKQVVEIMGDTARQLTETFQAMRLVEA
jgi:hypothetical protein